ncbi:TPM domain-containing protein [Cohnella yongneupensis]|uniref:TPM domain-containing protein n=1 Tax=Cohnella yongneupensis TaxID=425006 RepID=A0ABW0QZX4_9BACL
MTGPRRYGRKIAALLLFAVLWALPVAANGASAATSGDSRYGVYVVDEANVISSETKVRLYNTAIWLNQKTGSAQVGVVTVPSLEGTTLEQLAVDTFRKLGLGSSKLNDGVLLLYSAADKHVRIEVGYGLEGRITDGKAGAILDQYFVPNRDAGKLDEAFMQTQSALIVEVAAEYGIDATGSVEDIAPLAPAQQSDGEGFFASMPTYMKTLLGLGVVLLIVLDFKFTGGAVTWAILSMVGRRGGGGGGRSGGGRGGGGSSGGGGASR